MLAAFHARLAATAASAARAAGATWTPCPTAVQGRPLHSTSTNDTWPWALPEPVQEAGGERERPVNSGGHGCTGSSNYEQLRSNWAENVRFQPGRFVSPETVGEVQDAVAGATAVTVVGSAHSFNDIANPAPGGVQLSTAYLTLIEDIDVDSMTVTCGGGTTLGELCRYLAPRGCALPNLASFPQLTIAGAISTGTHGTGASFPGLAGNIAALELVTADGELLTARRDGCDESGVSLEALAVGLGCTGVITSVTLDILPEFRVDQRVYGGIPLAEFNAEAALRSADNVGALIDFGADKVELLYVRDRVEVDAPSPSAPLAEAYGGALVQGDIPAWESHHHMKTTSSGDWPSHLHFFMDDSLRDVPMPVLSLQTEYFVPLDVVDDALRALAPVAAAWPGWTTWDGADPTTQGPAHICEVRSIAGDNIWLSPSNGADAASIHFTLGFYPDVAWQIVRELEHALAPFGARPHWGKLWTECPIDGYSKADDFKALRADVDPTGKFCTAFTARALRL